MIDMLEELVETNKITNRLSVALIDNYNKELNTKNYKRQLVHFGKYKNHIANKNELKWKIDGYTVLKSLIIYEEDKRILYSYAFDRLYHMDIHDSFMLKINNLRITIN